MQHYHIQWADSKLDWQAFETEGEAQQEAERLKRSGEAYCVVKRDGACPRCMEMQRKMTGGSSQ
jgi:hypothetical protein